MHWTLDEAGPSVHSAAGWYIPMLEPVAYAASALRNHFGESAPSIHTEHTQYFLGCGLRDNDVQLDYPDSASRL